MPRDIIVAFGLAFASMLYTARVVVNCVRE